MPENIHNQLNNPNFHGPTNFHASTKATPRVLTSATAVVPSSFIGRERELSEIRALLTSQDTIALVNADGGMGKTTLAARYWQQYEGEYKHFAWLFCERGILAAMRSQLPQPLGLIGDINQCADDPDRQAEIIKAALANLPKDCLLVLDNANEPEHIRGFQQYMTGLGWHVLITSRCANVLADRRGEYKITGLPPEKARELFKQNHDEKDPAFDALLDRFLHAVGRNTLCIEVFSKYLRAGDWGLNFAQMLEKLEKNGLSLGDDSFEVTTDWAHNVKKVAVKSTDDVIAALYDMAGLHDRHPDLHDLLATLALLPAESHPSAVLVPLLAPDDRPGLKRNLDRLTELGWLAADAGTYRISPVVQKITLHRNAGRLWELGEPMVMRLHDIFEAEGYHPKNIATAGPFAELVPGLVGNLGLANQHLSILLDRLWYYHNATGNLAKALDTAHKKRELNERSGDKNSLAISYEKLGETQAALGNLDKALTFYEDETQLFEELYKAYPTNVSFKNGLAISYSKLGETQAALGNLDKALGFYEDETQLFEELYAAYPTNVSFKNGLAISYSKLGDTQAALGNLDKALGFYEERSRLGKELYAAYPTNVSFKNGLAISYSKLGETHTALGNLDKALGFYEKDIELSKELYAAYPTNVSFKNGLAISYSKLGETHTALGNLDKALGFYEKDIELSEELYKAYPTNVSFKNGLAISYLKLGEFSRDHLTDWARAKDYFSDAEKLWVELVRDAPQYVEFQRFLVQVRRELAGLE